MGAFPTRIAPLEPFVPNRTSTPTTSGPTPAPPGTQLPQSYNYGSWSNILGGMPNNINPNSTSYPGGLSTLTGTRTTAPTPIGGTAPTTATRSTAPTPVGGAAPTTAGAPQPGVFTPPQAPTFAPSTYVQSTVSGFPSNYTSTQPTLDSYLRASVNSLYNPSAIEKGTAIGDPTQMLTSLATNYLKMNPGTGSQADVQNLVNQYAGQYNQWANQYKQYLQNEGSNISLPGPGTSTPQQINTSGLANNAPQATNTAPTQAPTGTQNQSNNLAGILQQYFGNLLQPQYQTVKTPLGYTQYQATVPQQSAGGLDPMTQLVLAMLMGGYGNRGGTQGSFWNLLGGQ